MKTVTYNYINGLGRLKQLVVQTERTEGKYFCVIWDMATGEFCGDNKKTKTELKDFFDHYSIEEENFDEIFK